MLRILHIVSSMNYGGIQSFLMNVYNQIDRENIQFDFLVFSKENEYKDEIENKGGFIYIVSPRNKGIIKQKKELKNFFLHNKYDIVHYHTSSLTNVEPLKVAQKFGVKNRIVHSHNTHQQGSKIHTFLHKINKKRIHKLATNYYACSESASDWLFQNTKVKKEEKKVLYNGIDLQQFYFSTNYRIEKQRELELDDMFVIGHVARLTEQKNQFFLLDIFKNIVQLKSNVKLLIIGEGNLENDLKKYAEELKINDSVIFFGTTKNTNKYYSVMDLFLLPSNHEGLPVTLVEAQANGLPCVVSKEAVSMESKINNNFYRMSIYDSAEEWAKKCLNIDSNIKLRKQKSKNIEIFDIKHISETLLNIYKGMK